MTCDEFKAIVTPHLSQGELTWKTSQFWAEEVYVFDGIDLNGNRLHSTAYSWEELLSKLPDYVKGK